MPVFIYGKQRLLGLNGTVEINAPLKRGMIQIGKNTESFSMFDHSGFILIGSKNDRIIFEGPCKISVNAKLRVSGGAIRFGADAFLGANVRIISNGGNITIGRRSRIAYNTDIVNSSFHYMYDGPNRRYLNRTRDIIIGEFNWIGNNSTVGGGCVTPDYAIVAQRSVINRDYHECELYTMFAGAPAKPVKTGLKRVFSSKAEEKVDELFKLDRSRPYVEHEEFEDSYTK